MMLELFKEYDVNGDGWLSWEEFQLLAADLLPLPASGEVSLPGVLERPPTVAEGLEEVEAWLDDESGLIEVRPQVEFNADPLLADELAVGADRPLGAAARLAMQLRASVR